MRAHLWEQRNYKVLGTHGWAQGGQEAPVYIPMRMLGVGGEHQGKSVAIPSFSKGFTA